MRHDDLAVAVGGVTRSHKLISNAAWVLGAQELEVVEEAGEWHSRRGRLFFLEATERDATESCIG